MEGSSQKLGTGREVTCIAKNEHDEEDNRIVVGTRDMITLLFSVDPQAQLVTIFSVQFDKTVPKSVVFAENMQDVMVFGLYDGNVYVFYYCTFYGSLNPS